MRRISALLAVLLPLATPAHHSLSGQFDVSTTIDLAGVVSRVDWVNPHTYLYVEARRPDGSTLTYKLESLPVAMMRKAGLSKQDLLGNGAAVQLKFHPARNGNPALGYLVVLTMADGREIQFARIPGAEDPQGGSR